MISKQKLKLIKSLQLKKYQKQEQKFLVEGEKSVLEILNSRYKINILLATKRFLDSYQYYFTEKYFEIIEVIEEDLTSAGTLKTNNAAIAIVEMPENKDIILANLSILPVFESLQDPGNLGTVIRTCDWYGIDTIVLSNDSVDLYNPKVIQATMGSFTRVNVIYVDLVDFLGHAEIPVYGTKTRGENIYEVTWPDKVIIVFGNESKGIHQRLNSFITKEISIPKFGDAESLNVGIAAAVVLDNVRRQGL
jgi:TrmH family RNA methyltransferase